MAMSTALDIGSYFENVFITFLIVVIFFFLVLAFLYLIYGKEETTTATKPKT